MTQYEVPIERVERTTVVVEADDQDEATEKAVKGGEVTADELDWDTVEVRKEPDLFPTEVVSLD